MIYLRVDKLSHMEDDGKIRNRINEDEWPKTNATQCLHWLGGASGRWGRCQVEDEGGGATPFPPPTKWLLTEGWEEVHWYLENSKHTFSDPVLKASDAKDLGWDSVFQKSCYLASHGWVCQPRLRPLTGLDYLSRSCTSQPMQHPHRAATWGPPVPL